MEAVESRISEWGFWIGDGVGGALVGGVTALLVDIVVPEHFDMPLAMLIGMAIGMVVHLGSTILLSPLLGFFHAMVAGGLIGMYGGMLFAMQVSMGVHRVWPESTLLRGAVFGLVVALAIDAYDRLLRPADDGAETME